MRIAFVGKGGAGKTTLSTLFAQHLASREPVLAIDADINMHMAELLGVDNEDRPLISEKQPSEQIRDWLRGTSTRIPSNNHFKKTTPPSSGSRLIRPNDPDDWFMRTFSCAVTPRLHLVTVGSYSEDGIASSCYHNNLAILENILTHTVDDATIVADMVAGTDAFASTLFAQFDALVLAVEPTRRSIAVFEQYSQLATAGGVEASLRAVGNKVADADDEQFLRENLGNSYLGSITQLTHIARVDKGQEQLDVTQLDDTSRQTLQRIEAFAREHTISMQQRLAHIWDLHKTYVAQGFVRDRFGDLTAQIDTTFTYPEKRAAHE